MASSKSSSEKNTSISHSFMEISQNYIQLTPLHLKVMDSYMILCVALGVIQMLYCILVGTYPYNAFLAGFGSAVASFCLTANLRIKSNPINQHPGSQSPKAVFAEYVFCNFVLHFIVMNFLG
ncbi:hypothetical protein BB561_005644 [Smittium simulii]|uniref:Dolichyl-diphosphooligosaccharide--protein glycosyltransferase subunit OST2 n=1 Tax=Smittium simulii TaxID=133385 RepID=A0A2T9Y9A8_9FUNG|nr:hypothetical protein BB561_005644 [Smittium simulii]